MANEYKDFVNKFVNDLNGYSNDKNFKNLTNLILNSGANVNLNEHYLQQKIDISWIEAIEKTIIPLDNLLRSPRKFIKNEEEVVPIALARGITTDSIKHLAQHTNLIQAVDGDVVTPNKILEVRKEESYDTYENRFIATLIKKISFFLDKRMQIINENVHDDNQYEITYNGKFDFNQDKVNYSITFNYESKNRLDQAQLDDLINQDVNGLTPIQRIERLRKIMYDFQGSQFMKNMSNIPLIKPPLTMTNALKKNPDYKACVDLWIAIETYRGSGVSLNIIDRKEVPDNGLAERLMQFTALQYLFLKDFSNGLEEDFIVNEVIARPLEKKVEEIVNAYDFNVDEVKKIFLDKIARKEKKKFAIEKRLISVIRECLKDETDFKIKSDKKLSQEKVQAHARRRKAELLRNVQKHRKVDLDLAKRNKSVKVIKDKKKPVKNKKRAKPSK